MSLPKQNFNELLELINLYPSPHNGQPIRLKVLSDQKFEVYFQRERGLQAADISFIFSFVSMGVFMEHIVACAQALGHGCSYTLSLPAEKDLRGDGLVQFASCTFSWNSEQPKPHLVQTLHFRQTSRKKYIAGVDAVLADKVQQLAATAGMQLTQLDKAQTRQTIWLNQRAVFDDMFDEPTRRELDHWLRYSQAQKRAKRDGLSYDCMELNGPLMKFVVNHPGFLHAPVLSGFIQKYYLRTMMDNSDAFYMLAPFGTEQAAFNVGLVIMKIWLAIAEAGYYLHPFGTIMSNQAAHHDFLKLANINNESRAKNYLVFIFRAGQSKPPVRSLRLPTARHLLLGGNDD